VGVWEEEILLEVSGQVGGLLRATCVWVGG
jgi:hypothetical protein